MVGKCGWRYWELTNPTRRLEAGRVHIVSKHTGPTGDDGSSELRVTQ